MAIVVRGVGVFTGTILCSQSVPDGQGGRTRSRRGLTGEYLIRICRQEQAPPPVPVARIRFL